MDRIQHAEQFGFYRYELHQLDSFNWNRHLRNVGNNQIYLVEEQLNAIL
jgi:hypothetical protein